MTSANHAGWQVEAYDTRLGWRRASKVFASYIDACRAYDQWPVKGVELRIAEALQPIPLTAAQWLGEWGQRVRRFYRINERKA